MLCHPQKERRKIFPKREDHPSRHQKTQRSQLQATNRCSRISRSIGRIFRDLSKHFYRIGYTPNIGIMNAADFGVPQIRRRLFVLACSNGHRFDFPSPTHSPTGRDGLPKYVSIKDSFRKLSGGLPNDQIPRNTETKKKMLARMIPGSEW